MGTPSPPKSKSARVKILRSLLPGDGDAVKGYPGGAGDDWEYSVGNTWLDQLLESLHKEDDSVTIPPIQSSPTEDNKFIGETAWKVLVSWYGLSETFQIRRRPKTSTYVQIPTHGDKYILADRYLDFVDVQMCLLDDADSDKITKKCIYFWESYSFLILQLQRTLDIPPGRRLRVWVMLVQKGKEVLEMLQPQSVQSAGSFGALLCSKVHPLVDQLIRRQELPPLLESAGSLSSFNSAKPPLNQVLANMQIEIKLCVEEIQTEYMSVLRNASPIDGISSSLLVTKQPDNWSMALDDLLNTFEKEVQVSAKTKRDELYENVKYLISDNFAAADKVKSEAETCKTQQATRESRLNEREKELDVREHELNTKVDKFKRGLTEFLMQKKKLETELKLIEQQNKFSDTRVELNVGGVKFTTSTLTLTKDQNSTLALMFSGRHPLHKEADGSYFIDRDGTHFRHILNFLRDGSRSTDSLPVQASTLHELQTEAEFFQLHELAAIIKGKMSSSCGGLYASMPP